MCVCAWLAVGGFRSVLQLLLFTCRQFSSALQCGDVKPQLRRSKSLERFGVYYTLVRQELLSEAVFRQVDDDVLRGAHTRAEECQKSDVD